MRILLIYVHEDEKLQKCRESLKKYSPNLVIEEIHADPKISPDALYQINKYCNSERFQEDIMIWHPDMYATEGWLERLQKFYNQFDVVGTKLIYPNGLIHHFGGIIVPDGRGMHPHQGALNIGWNRPVDCAYVTGPGTIIKKYVWEKVGEYDPQFFKGYYGDADWCFRARKAGFSIGVVPVEIYHDEGEDLLKRRPKWLTQKYQIDHLAIFIAKHIDELSKFREWEKSFIQ